MTPAALLWDVGDTLVDGRWMRRPPPECPGWEPAWVAVVDEHVDDWNVGHIGAEVVDGALADLPSLGLD